MEIQSKGHKIFGRPRASEEEKRSVKFSIFLTKSEAEALKSSCKESKINPPEFLRRAGLNKKIEARKSVFDAAALTELRAAGQNINKTARDFARARTERIPVDYKKAEMILQRQLEIIQALKTAIFNRN